MTDFFSGKKPFSERHSPRLKNKQKPYSDNVRSGTNDSLRLTEQHRMQMRGRNDEKNYATAFCRFLPLSANAGIITQKRHSTAHILKPYCITFKIVLL